MSDYISEGDALLYMDPRAAVVQSKLSARPAGADYGCSDHGCVFGHPGGMGTNGGCKCLEFGRDIGAKRTVRQGITALRADLQRAQDELATVLSRRPVIAELMAERDQHRERAETAERKLETANALLAATNSWLADLLCGGELPTGGSRTMLRSLRDEIATYLRGESA